MRLSHRQRSPPGYAVRPPLLVPVSNCDRYTPSCAMSCRTGVPFTSRSGWKCNVARHDGSAGSPVASFVTWAIALSRGHGMAAVSTNSGDDGDGNPGLPWLFNAPEGGPLRESNWKRSVRWSTATSAAGVPGFRVHDLRHTAASVWLAAGADPKVVQRVLGHATAAMTMDLHGHMVDANLWQAARLVGDISGTLGPPEGAVEDEGDHEPG